MPIFVNSAIAGSDLHRYPQMRKHVCFRVLIRHPTYVRTALEPDVSVCMWAAQKDVGGGHTALGEEAGGRREGWRLELKWGAKGHVSAMDS